MLGSTIRIKLILNDNIYNRVQEKADMMDMDVEELLEEECVEFILNKYQEKEGE